MLGPSRAIFSTGGSLTTELAAEASGRQAVELNATGQYVQFTTLHACNSIVVRLSVPDAPAGNGQSYTLGVYVDGTLNQELPVTSRYTWDYKNWSYPYDKNPADGSPFHLYDEVHALLGVDLPAGHVIQLMKGPSDSAAFYSIDLVDLEEAPPPLTMPAGYVSIASYGAVGDGSTDNSAAIQSAVNFAVANGLNVWIPQGDFASLSAEIGGIHDVIIQGAGMWYSAISGYDATLDLAGNNCRFHDFALLGDTVNRVDTNSDNGFNFGGGTGSVLQGIWIEHEKCGYWVGGGTSPTSNGLLVTGCRVRDTYADGVNLCNGTSSSTVTQCQFRGNGDDALASWSPSGSGVNDGNSFSFNTVQSPWRADCYAFYGGTNNSVTDCLCSDTVDQAGIMVEQGFSSNDFGGTNNILRDTLVRAGGYFTGDYGAIDFWANQGALLGAWNVGGLDIESPTYGGIEYNGSNAVNGVTVTSAQVNNAGTYGIQVMPGASGSSTLSGTVVVAPGTAGLLNSGSMTLLRGPGDSGW